MTERRPSGETRRLDRRRPTARSIQDALLTTTETPRPRRVGEGPAFFTAYRGVERQPFSWDTNCFYLRLGLSPDCSRLDIIAAYHATDPRQPGFDARMVALRVLLKKSVRTRYDRVMLGSFWTDDPALFETMFGALVNDDILTGEEEWGVYADVGVADSAALELASGWRILLSEALDLIVRRRWGTPLPVVVAVGATDRPSRARWEQMGFIPVLFVPLDAEPSLEYVSHAAETFVRSADIVRVGTSASPSS